MYAVYSVLVIVLFGGSNAQGLPRSPCPEVFTYEGIGPEPARWYGVLTLPSDTTIHGLRLQIDLDSKADILGNWAGEVLTKDNMNFRIENSELRIEPHRNETLRFFVQYNLLNKVPILTSIRLNGRELCNANAPRGFSETRQPSRKSQGFVATENPSFRENNHESYNKQPETNYDYFIGGLPDIPKATYDMNLQCGKVVRQPTPLIVNGRPTEEGNWPWQIALYRTQNINSLYMCGGTLVSRNYVVTAAHCVTEKGSSHPINKNTITIYLGKHNLRTSTEGVQIKFVEKIIVHPQYGGGAAVRAGGYGCDLAVLALREAAVLTELVRTVCLWPSDQLNLGYVIGKKGTVVGWGIDEKGQTREDLTLVEMPVVSQETCIRSNSDFFGRHTSDFTYCAGHRDGASVCNGDSGGGMVFKIGDTWFLRGVTSLSVARSDEGSCDTSHYVIFTDVAKFLDWLKEVMTKAF